eukprot:scaffold318267_cov27-Tisochrysis_lutea.AAC.1
MTTFSVSRSSSRIASAPAKSRWRRSSSRSCNIASIWALIVSSTPSRPPAGPSLRSPRERAPPRARAPPYTSPLPLSTHHFVADCVRTIKVTATPKLNTLLQERLDPRRVGVGHVADRSIVGRARGATAAPALALAPPGLAPPARAVVHPPRLLLVINDDVKALAQLIADCVSALKIAGAAETVALLEHRFNLLRILRRRPIHRRLRASREEGERAEWRGTNEQPQRTAAGHGGEEQGELHRLASDGRSALGVGCLWTVYRRRVSWQGEKER